MKNIFFFLDTEKKPSGGRKIIFQYCNYIDSLKNYNSSIVFVQKKKIYKFKQSIKKKLGLQEQNYGWKFNDLKINKKPNLIWTDYNINVKENLKLNRKTDFVILPEIFSHFAENFLIREKIPYAIFVQNGYAIFSSSDYKKINKSYKKAKFILSYSKDINDCILTAFPFCKNKILKLVPAIESTKLYTNKKKQNLITYMPRKLKKHSELVLLFLKKYLPKSWKVKPIENLNEKAVFQYLKKSKIFLSFSELEGLGMPPIEAALAGNKIIGYTGEAGKEYWKEPVFTEIKNGEIKNFCKCILKNLKLKNFRKEKSKIINELSKKYSLENQNLSILNFLKKIN